MLCMILSAFVLIFSDYEQKFEMLHFLKGCKQFINHYRYILQLCLVNRGHMNVQWHEGMLLSPHHFQQTDNHVQHLFSLVGGAFHYGVFDITMDTASLASGVIRVLTARGIFQDGLYFEFDALKDHPLEKKLSDFLETHNDPVKIYLAIHVRRTGENLVSGTDARYYSAEIQNINDENSGSNPINIPILKPKLQLLLENELDARYVSFPIFEAQKSVDGGVRATNFIPPFITIDEHSKISEKARDVAQMIRNKASYFADRRDNFEHNENDEAYSNLRCLIQALLPLETLVRINGIHPFDLYKCMLETVAKVIATNPTQLIPRLPTYDHNDLFATFYKVSEYVKKIIDGLKQKYQIIRFEKNDSMFTISLRKEWMKHGEIAIGVQRAFSSSDGDVINWINSAQIASEAMMQLIKDRRVLGAERKILERGSYIVQPNGMTIMSVKLDNSYIVPAEKLCIVNHSYPIVPDSLVLYAEC